jgi:hypothetical protein
MAKMCLGMCPFLQGGLIIGVSKISDRFILQNGMPSLKHLIISLQII